jgi:hypothetical protein
MASGSDIIGSAAASKSKKVYMGRAPEIIELVLGCMFDKLVPILEINVLFKDDKR